jgi:CBS domain-containing protein
MSKYRNDYDDRDDVYETRRGRARSYAEERFNESQRGDDYDRNQTTGERQFDYRGPSAAGYSDNYGRGGDYGDMRGDYTSGSGAISGGGGRSYARSDYGQRGYDEGRDYYEGRNQREEGRRRGGATRSHVRCRDIMTRDVTVATRQSTLQEVARMMRDEDTGVIPVVERSENTPQPGDGGGSTIGNGRLVGLITDRDIVIRAIAEGRDGSTTAEEIMTREVYTAQPNDRVIDAIRKMGDKQVRRIPVVDRDGSLRGIISMADVALETEEDRELANALEEISSGSSFWSKIFG